MTVSFSEGAPDGTVVFVVDDLADGNALFCAGDVDEILSGLLRIVINLNNFFLLRFLLRGSQEKKAPVISSQESVRSSFCRLSCRRFSRFSRYFEKRADMGEKEYYRLCGGTFFVLLADARKPALSKAECYGGKRSGITEPEMLLALAKVLTPDLSKPMDTEMRTIKDNTRDFKMCTNWGGRFLRLNDAGIRKSFDDRVKQTYHTPLAEMSRFVNEFLDVCTSTKKDEYLIKALVEVIAQDEGIDPGQSFFVCEDGCTMTKSNIIHATQICVQPFLLGIWHYVITGVEDNRIGANTYNEWCPAQGGAERPYIAAIGEQSTRSIQLEYCEIATDENEDVPLVDTDVVEDDFSGTDNDNPSEDKSKPDPKSVKQTIMNNYGNGVQIDTVSGNLTINIK